MIYWRAPARAHSAHPNFVRRLGPVQLNFAEGGERSTFTRVSGTLERVMEVEVVFPQVCGAFYKVSRRSFSRARGAGGCWPHPPIKVVVCDHCSHTPRELWREAFSWQPLYRAVKFDFLYGGNIFQTSAAFINSLSHFLSASISPPITFSLFSPPFLFPRLPLWMLIQRITRHYSLLKTSKQEREVGYQVGWLLNFKYNTWRIHTTLHLKCTQRKCERHAVAYMCKSHDI